MTRKSQKTSEIKFQIIGWIIVPMICILSWHFLACYLKQPWILPSPLEVVKTLAHPWRDHYACGSFFENTIVSLLRVGFGFMLATLIAVPIGLLLGAFKPLRQLFEPMIELLRPLCPIAWLPFAIAVFKLTTLPQLFGWRFTSTIFDQIYLGILFVLFWGAFFPILINTIDGTSGVRQNYLLLARTLGANKFQLFYKVYLPAALPMILTGLRQGLALCWFVIIAAEMLPGTDSGIGYLLIYSADQSDMAVVLAAIIIIGVIGAFLNFAMVSIMRIFVKWHGREL